jgi:hypothetical protein
LAVVPEEGSTIDWLNHYMALPLNQPIAVTQASTAWVVNCIVDESGAVYALEFTPRAGYDATPTLEKQKAESGLAHRADLVTFFDYYEVDEGRAPR